VNAIVGKVFRNVRSYDNQPAQKRLVASFNGTGFVAEREDDKLQIYLISAENIATNAFGDAPASEGPEGTRMKFLSQMTAEERADAERRAAEQARLAEAQAQRERESSSKWNATQTSDRCLPVRLPAPRTSISVEGLMKNVAETKALLNHMCGCRR
jgi:hypothetical protein